MLAKNCMISVHKSTPYAALFGRVPNLLPDFEKVSVPMTDDISGGAASRHIHRMREIAIQNIVQGTAQDRLNRASSSRTRPAGELLGLKIGDHVEFYRDPPNKD
eukprot:1782093-Karenia_brevis.AAC.1